MADLSKLRFNGTDYNVKDASAPTRKFTNAYSKTGNLPISSDDTTQTAIGKLENNIIPKSAKGTANGVAELDANGKVPSSQLPSYVDDVLEYSAKSSFPATGESGKIYVDTTTNKTYRWSGSAYVEISESLALGETDSTAYRGDRGKTAYDHSQRTSGNPHNVTKSDVGLGNVGNFKAVSTEASQGLSDTEKSNARANIGAGTGNGTYSKPSGGIPKSDLASAVQSTLDQVNTNQTNILYALNTGVKNKLPCAIANINQPSDTGITCKYNDDGSYTITGTKLASDSYLNLGVIRAENLVGSHYVSITSTGTGSIQLAAYGWNGTGYTLMLSTSTAQGFSVGNYTMILVRLRFMGSVNTSFNAVVKPMICTEDAWNQSTDFMPPALPNYDLTYLEAQDRAELVELVDSGAKQLLQFNNDTSGQLVATVQSDGYTVKVTGGESTGKTVTYATASISKTGSYALKVDLSGTGASCYLYDATTSTQIKEFYESTEEYFTLTAGHTYNIKTYRAGTNTNATIALLLCTKAAFGVSQKFVAYRGTFGNKTVGTVDMNSLTVEGNYYVSNATKATHHAPKDGYFFVDVYTTENGEKWQKAYRINEPQYIYQRQMTSNTWGTWYIFTGTAVS